MADEGAAKLSVRAVAREVGMVSSAVYRYFPTRDELLTALIVDAYDALAEAVEQAAEIHSSDCVRIRWRAVCAAVRRWGSQHPHEYRLIFGSPIPGYRAPQETVAPAARIPGALLGVVGDGWKSGQITVGASPPTAALLNGQVTDIATALVPGLPPVVVLRCAIAWTQLFGMVTFELFGQFVGSLDPADEFFDAAVEAMADVIGMSAGAHHTG